MQTAEKMVRDCANYNMIPEAYYVIGLCQYYKADFESASDSFDKASDHPDAMNANLKTAHFLFLFRCGESQ